MVVVKIENLRNPLFRLDRPALREAIAEWRTAYPPDVKVVVDNGHPHTPFTFASDELQ